MKLNHIKAYIQIIGTQTDSHIFFIRFIGIISTVVSSLLIYFIGRKLHSRLAGIFGIYVFGLTMTWGLLDGECTSQTETFMILFSILSFYFVIKGKDHRIWKYWLILTGISMGIAIAFKQIAITTTLALIFFILVYTMKNKTKKDALFGLILLVFGIGISTFISIIPLLLSGVTFKDYVDGAWSILLSPGSSASLTDHMYGFFRIWLNSRIAVFYPCLFLLVFQRDIVKNSYFFGLLVWLLFDFIGVNVSGNYFGHQIKQLMPALSVIIGVLLSNLMTTLKQMNSAETKNISITITILIIILFPYKDIIINGYLKGYPNHEKEIGVWLKENTNEKEYVYI